MRAIFNVLSRRMLTFAREALMDPTKIPETPWFREFRLELEAAGVARGKAEGKQEDLLTILAARGLRIPAAQRKRILECTDLGTLHRWIERAATADSVDEALGPAPKSPQKRAATQARPPARRRSSHA